MSRGPLGAVLAGGRSRRFGAPKPLALFLGEPLVGRALDALTPVCSEVVVVTHLAEIGIALAVRTLTDRVPDAGPLAGLESALRHAHALGRDGVLLLGCDMPLVQPVVLALLLAEARAHRARATVPGVGAPHKGVQPLCGWYSVECLPAVAARLDAGERSLRGLLGAVGAWLVPRERLRSVCDPDIVFRGANTPGELRDLEELVRPCPPPASRTRGALPQAHGR